MYVQNFSGARATNGTVRTQYCSISLAARDTRTAHPAAAHGHLSPMRKETRQAYITREERRLDSEVGCGRLEAALDCD